MYHSMPGGWTELGVGSVVVYIEIDQDPRERKYKLLLKPWACVKDMKDQLQVLLNIPSQFQKLFYKGRELKNGHNLQQCGIYRDNMTIYMTANNRHTQSASNMNGIHRYGAHLYPRAILKAVHLAMQGIALGLAPELAMDGTGGTYFLKDPSHRKVGCFKPQDEEPFAPNNPRGFVGTMGQPGLRKGILSGEACERELAAYLLDINHFAGVPATTLVEAKHPAFRTHDNKPLFKMGSLQDFVKHDDVASDLSPSVFTPHQVHKIVLLDIRLLNTDRNDANILVRRKRNAQNITEYELIPIDHGYCLPDYIEIAWCDWCWYDWPQLKVPLGVEDKKYVLSLDAEKDVELLSEKIPLRSGCKRNMLISGMLLQKAIQLDLTLYDIAKIICRDDMDTPSPLEKTCEKAINKVFQMKRDRHPLSIDTSDLIKYRTYSTQQEELSSQTSATPPPTIPAATSKNTTYSTKSLSIEIPSTPNGSITSSSMETMKSPPGFWASFDPFRSTTDSTKQHSLLKGSYNWDDMLSNADTTTTPPLLEHFNTTTTGRSATTSLPELNASATGTISSSTSPEKDVNEMLAYLDSNPKDEKCFMQLVSQYIDIQVSSLSKKKVYQNKV